MGNVKTRAELGGRIYDDDLPASVVCAESGEKLGNDRTVA